MKNTLIFMACVLIAAQVSAQNKIPQNSYNNHSALEQSAIERMRAVAVARPDPNEGSYQFETPQFFADKAVLLGKASLCGKPSTDTIFTLAEESFAHLESRFLLEGWRYALQDCWVFVNRTHPQSSPEASTESHYFQAIEYLQSQGLLKTELINAQLRGSTVVYNNKTANGVHTVTAFRLADLVFYR